jgi:hypothetical protein
MPATPSEDSDVENDTTDFTEEDIKNSLDALSLRNQRKQIRHELTDPFVSTFYIGPEDTKAYSPS